MIRRVWQGRKTVAALVFLLASACLLPVPAQAQSSKQPIFPGSALPRRPPPEPIDAQASFLLEADEVSYHEQDGLVTAQGNVEISQGNRLVRADRLSYNRKDDVVTATGNVTLIEPSGDIVSGDYVELTSGLKNAIINNFKGLLVDNSRVAAANVTTGSDGSRTMIKGVFSPCNLCRTDPSRPPTWQIKGVQITHDAKERKISYRDARLEIYGVPVFYFPYFFHPDSTVKRQSGLLFPELNYTSNLGFYYGQPYYGMIDPSSDITLMPRIMSKEGLLLAGEYRKRFATGSFRMAGSITDGNRVDGSGAIIKGQTMLRDSFSSEALFDIDDHWRGGFDLEHISDPTYLKRYRLDKSFRPADRFNFTNQLTSDAFAEGFFQRNYADISFFDFRSTIYAIPSSSLPRVHPFAQYEYYSARDPLGGRFTLDSNLLAISRRQGSASSRLSETIGYQLPITDRLGGIWTTTLSMQADTYAIKDHPISEGDGMLRFTGNVSRLFPKARLDWRYPMVARGERFAYLVEPRIDAVAAATSGNSVKIPNEDSLNFEFSDTNLFSDRRLGGYDRLDTGQRFDYGVTGGMYHDQGVSLTGFLGQSYQPRISSAYLPNSGLDTHFSDYVGRLTLSPVDWLDLNYRFRANSQDLSARRQEASANITLWDASLGVSYLQYQRPTRYDIAAHHPKQLGLSANLPLWSGISVHASYLGDIASTRPLYQSWGLVYRDECFGMALDFEKTHTTNGDIKPGMAILLRLGFKYLGDVRL